MKNISSKTVVLFGATGGVGAYLTLYLLEKKYNVIAVGKRKSDNGFFKNLGIKYYSVDIRNKNEFSILPHESIFAVVHLAGMLPANMIGYNPQEYIDSNITGTLNILNYCASIKIQKIVFPTTLADVYHLCGTANPIDPDSISRFPINSDHSVYTITKNAAVGLIQHYSAKHNFINYIIRFANVFLYHPKPYYYVNGEKRMKELYNIIEEAKMGSDIELWGDPNRMRDVFYVKDCTQLIEKCLSSNSNGGTYNVGTGVGTTRLDQIKGIIEIFSPNKKKSCIIHKADKQSAPQVLLNIDKNIKELGYTPKYDYLNFLKDFKNEMEINRFEKLWGKPEDYNSEN